MLRGTRLIFDATFLFPSKFSGCITCSLIFVWLVQAPCNQVSIIIKKVVMSSRRDEGMLWPFQFEMKVVIMLSPRLVVHGLLWLGVSKWREAWTLMAFSRCETASLEPCVFTALFTNMRILKFKSQPTIAFFTAVNHLNEPLRRQNFTLTVSKGYGL